MNLSRILRPSICHFATAIISPQSFNRIFMPVTSSINLSKGSNVDIGCQTRGFSVACVLRRQKKDFSHLKPLNFDFSEDLVKQKPLDPTEIVFKYRGITEINELPDHAKKLLTISYATSQERLEHRSAVLLEKMTNALGPGPCLEKEICYLTVKIRNLIPYIVSDRRNKCHKHYLHLRIAKRKKLLLTLRRLDYDRFHWLLKELQVTCTPVGRYDYHSYSKTPKRARRKRETREEALRQKREKLENLEAELNKEREKFFEIKGKVLEEIDRDIKKFGLDKVEIVTSFQNRLKEQRQEKLEERRKLSKVQKYIKEMAAKKERDSRVF